MEVNVQFPSVVSPRSELEFADLDVEREVEDVNGTGGTKDGGRKPQDVAFVTDDRHCVTMLLQTSVGAVRGKQEIAIIIIGNKIFGQSILSIHYRSIPSILSSHST